jgi:hypothetical protein
MWLKVLLQLRELLPHLTRLAPVMEHFLSQRRELAQASAIDPAIFENLSGDIGEVTKAHAALYRVMQDQTESIGQIEAEVRILRTLADNSQRRIGDLEEQVSSLGIWLKSTAILSLILLITLVVLVLRH